MKRYQYIDSDGQILLVEVDGFENKYYSNSNDQLHRLDGPAAEYSDGSYRFVENGRIHRIGGPAWHIKYPLKNGNFWYINGKEVNVYYIYG